jgi:hypothetical protein
MIMQVRNSWRIGAVTAGLLTIVLATTLASPAMAYVVEVTTAIDLTDVADKAQLRQAVKSAVEDVLANAISFSPTRITVQNARVVGDRMYLLLLIVDAAGEKALETMAGEGAASRDSDGVVNPTTPGSNL